MTSSIVYGQGSTEKVLITRDEQRQCIKWYFENQYKDSIILVKDSITTIQLGMIRSITDDFNQCTTDNTTLKNKVRRNRNYAILSGSGFLAMIGLYFSKKD